MKAPFPYYGGKSRIADQIVALMPSHRHYIEPFAGALSVLLAKPAASMETVNDLNGDIVHFFATLRDHLPELERACTLTPHSRAEHQLARANDVGLDPIERARRTFVHLSQGRAASLMKTGWAHFNNADTTHGGGRSAYLQTLVGRFAPIADRLLNVSLECRDALEVIAEYGKHSGNLLYIDPPYLGTTRDSRGYQSEFVRADQHRDLLDAVLACKATVMLSGYGSDLYDQSLTGWCRRELVGARAQSNKPRREIIWSNADLDSYLEFEVTA